MTDNQRVVQIIFNAVDELNQQLPKEQYLEKSTDTALLGRLDSLGLINLIVATEQKIEEDLGASITLVDERTLSQENSPLRNIGALADHVALLLGEKTNG